MSVVKEFIRNTIINGHTVPVKIEVIVDEETDSQPEEDFDFGDDKKNADYLARFHSGELFMGTIEVKASALGESAYDCLGGCHLFSNNMYDSAAFEKSVSEHVTDYGMVDNAISELVKMIQEKAKQLSKYA